MMTDKKNISSQTNSQTLDKVRMGSNVLVSLIVGAAILLMVNYLSMRHYNRSDWTSTGLYTLSDKTVKIVKNLDKEVAMYVLWSQGDPRFMDVKEILDNYAGLSPRLKVEMVDPDMNPERVQLIVQKYGAKVQMDAQGNMGIEAGIFVTSGDNVKFVSSEEFEDHADAMFNQDPETGEEMSEFKAEQEITAAVMRVISDEQISICFTQGHGERPLDGFGAGTLGHVKEGLKRDSYKVESFPTAGTSKVPEGCDMVVVSGPNRTFMTNEAAMLKGYLKNGGKLMLLLDPIVKDNRFIPTGLESLCANDGILLGSDIIMETDPQRLPSKTPVTFLISEFGVHKAVKQLSLPDAIGADAKEQTDAFPVVFSMARSLGEKDTDTALVDNLAKTSTMSWGEVDLASLGSGDSAPTQDQYDTAGPVVVGMIAVETTKDKEKAGKLLVIGDSDFLEEELFVNSSLYNRDFWSGLVGWMTAREDLVSIAPKNPEHIRLSLTKEDAGTIWWTLIGEVILVIALGVMVWMRRRS